MLVVTQDQREADAPQLTFVKGCVALYHWHLPTAFPEACLAWMNSCLVSTRCDCPALEVAVLAPALSLEPLCFIASA